MSKAQETRQKIVREAALLFNRQGYAGASMADIMRVTGLQKGGIYNHFGSKEELALEAFEYMIQEITRHYMAAIRSQRHAVDRLLAMLEVYRHYIDQPPIEGGCPILNTAVESDDTHPVMRQRVRQALDSWQSLIRRVLERGMERGEVRPGTDADELATLLIAMVEGAVMMSKVYDDSIYLERAIRHLQIQLQAVRADAVRS
ncbi:TetR/AcrR family transcriptional regulator [Pseudanabaena sp. FACHB-2040]|uniref:TetR/AcrR family transcriptional regulator n=1 Tax=Pseudanabaena sp. FACHB-2040 TaxID=2692859 RepID=UPI001684C93E|nr:TetR/AcrR family transcriptional regulator [Pseudanabaena sp. FACHB-2040]MBD2259234.1 TetR/AcrR family transcriptional regulator [Pseudanabaena sp. FACHB-2040]